MALWGFPLNSAMEAEVYVDLNAMDSANDWIEAPWGRAKMASSCESILLTYNSCNPIFIEIALLSLSGPSPCYTLNDVD
jgi:hypothetical protein